MADFSNPLDTFFVNFFSPFYSHPSIELFVTIIVNIIYFYGFYEAYFFIMKKDKKRLLQFAATAAIGLLLVFSLKYYVERPRPYQAFDFTILEAKGDPSFPSAHTFLAFLFYYFVNAIPKTRRRGLRAIFATHLLVLVPAGLMITGVHYFTDVLAGAILGFVLPKIFTENAAARIFKMLRMSSWQTPRTKALQAASQ
jgi:membrane-associated phospholipid phosphatase